MADLAIRKRTKKEAGPETFCSHCGRPFQWVAKTESGKILYYHCPACDRPEHKK